MLQQKWKQQKYNTIQYNTIQYNTIQYMIIVDIRVPATAPEAPWIESQ
jgi:hypothetical protein